MASQNSGSGGGASGISGAFKTLFTTPFRDFLLTKKNWGDTDQVEVPASEALKDVDVIGVYFSGHWVSRACA